MKKFKSTIIFILLSIFALSLIFCSKKEEEKGSVKIGYLAITHALPLYIEKEVEKEDIELVKFGSWPELMEALNSGKIDGASVLVELAMKAKAQGINIKAAALSHREGNAVVVNENIDSVKDLRGKTLAVPNKLSTHYILLYEMLKEENMSLDDIKITELAPAEMAVALQEERIDGYCVAEPFGAKSVVNGNGKILKQSSDLIPNSICCTLVFRGEFIDENRDKAKDVLKNYLKSAEYLEENEDDKKVKSKEFLKVQKEVLDLSLNWINFKDLKIQKEDYDKINDYLKEMDLFSEAPSYEEFVDNSLIDGVINDEK